MEEKEVTLKELFQNIKSYSSFVWKRKWWLLIVGLVFTAYSFWKTINQKVIYEAELSYLVTEDESGAAGVGVSAILGQFGIPGGGGRYNYNKIVELSKSTKLIKKVVFDSFERKGRFELIGNEIIKKYQIKCNDKHIMFEHQNFADLDSLEKVLFRKVYLLLVGSEHKSTHILETTYNEDDKIIRTIAKSLDPDLSIAVSQSLFIHLNSFYNHLVKGSNTETFTRLKSRTDSLQSEIRKSEYAVASQKDKLGFVQNIQRLPEIQHIQKLEMLYAIYGETVKSLETAQLLNSNTDFFTTIDHPYKPLKNNKKGMIVTAIVSFLLGAVLASIVFIIQKFFRENL